MIVPRQLFIVATAAIALALGSFAWAGEPIELFNGKNLDGWYKFIGGQGRNKDPKNVFTVHDGMIHITGEQYGCITTDKSFSNYKLTVEFKWGGKTFTHVARDSGVLIHSFGPDGAYNGVWKHSIEANIVEGGIGDFWIVGGAKDGIQAKSKTVATHGGKRYDPVNGRPVTVVANSEGGIGWIGKDPEWKNVKGFRGKNDLDKPGEWVKMVIVAKDDNMTVYVNDKRVLEMFECKPAAGQIQLQSEGAEIFFRKVTLEPLE